MLASVNPEDASTSSEHGLRRKNLRCVQLVADAYTFRGRTMSDSPSSASTKTSHCYSTSPATNQCAGYGFRYIGRNGRLIKVADPEERAVMARIVEARETGKSFYQIAAQLLWDGVKTRDGQEWSQYRVRRAYDAELALRAAEPARTKRCWCCGDFKPVTTEHFHRHGAEPDGFQRICKECRRRDAKLKRQHARRKPFLLLRKAMTRGLNTYEGAAAYEEGLSPFKTAEDFASAFKESCDRSKDPEYTLELFDTMFRMMGGGPRRNRDLRR